MRLFGIAVMEFAEHMSPEEQWDVIAAAADGENDVTTTCTRIRKFVFVEHESQRPLGTIYLDLFPRDGKYGHAAHFTVRCGCVLDAMSHSSSASDSDATSSSSISEGQYQLPIIALVCNFTPPTVAPVLAHAEVETLFHEFGHAIHSLLSRTAFQHLSGTRTAMDFVETPSHWMEQYVWDASFLQEFLARHYQTGDPPPPAMIQALVQSRFQFRSLEVQQQLLYAHFDQILFGPPQLSTTTTAPTTNTASTSTQIFAQLHQQRGMPYADGTHWHSRFGHLVTYAGGYYSYLYAQVFASDIWDHCFVDGGHPQREAGLRWWNKVLIHGGARDPHVMLRDLLGRPPRVDSFFRRMYGW